MTATQSGPELDLPAGRTYTVGSSVLAAGGITDEELTALAMAATIDENAWDGAVPDPVAARSGQLPQFYMPPSMGGDHSRSLRLAAVLIVLGLLFVTAMGFCVTYGQLSFA